MHLKKLELVGFKSFADRTILELSSGLNAVVGPNGSGKSNIADALRWVLGEQSAKQLRGGKMEDVIFAGTAHRKPLGYAEIIMRIDNSEGLLPLEFPEISVARRVYRSGESEYSINGEICRLKDIQMLFMDTGVGRDGYSIIGQGRIDEILSLRSEDRRMVFEEAAGIGKFKTRRNEALSKLEREKQNRERVDDIIYDIEEQLPPLETQSEEAKRYLDLRDKYKNIHINIFLDEIIKIQNELEHIETVLVNTTSQFEDGKRLLHEARAAGESLKQKVAHTDQEYKSANENLLEITTNIEKKEGESNLLESRRQQLIFERARLITEIEKREKTLVDKQNELVQEEENHSGLKTELEKLNRELIEHTNLSAHIDAILKESNTEIEKLNQAIIGAHAKSADCRADVTETENAYIRLEEDKEALDIEIENHDSKVEAHAHVAKEAEQALLSYQSELERAHSSVEAYTSAYNQLSEQTEEAENTQRKTQEKLTIASGSYKAIANLEAQHEGFYQSVKNVLRKKATDQRFAGICGAVGELVGVQKEYEIAIETALGGAAQNIVTKTENDAKLAINMLKETKGGRATFLPLTAVKGRTINAAAVKNEPGFVAIASELVTYDTEFEQVIAQLLGDVLIVDNMDNALALNKKHRYSYKIVTLDGERLSPGGAITGGGTTRQTTGIVGRARQLEELKQQVETLTAELSELAAHTTSLREKRKTTEETLNTAKEKEQQLTLETERLKDKLNTANETLNNLNSLAASYNEENEKIMTRLIEQNQIIRQAKDVLKVQEEEAAKAQENLEQYKAQIEKRIQEQTEESDTVTELKITISRQTERREQAEKTIDRLTGERETLRQEITTLRSEKEIAETKAEETKAEREALLTEIEVLKASQSETRTTQTSAETQKTELEKAIAKAEADERNYVDSTAKVEKELTRLEARKESLDTNSRRLHDEIYEEYNLTYQQALQYKTIDVPDTALKKVAQELKAELATLTNVNVGAIEAYKQLKSRYEFLTSQRDDILKAESSLNELIENLTHQMEEQFASQFKLIAQHFEEVFKQMFSGGKASLRLLDTDNVLESGIEIIAQPPGKSLQNLMLLSGGERALTAIALLFSILRLKPSPFCVLDEIESALDDANVTRFASYLKEYAKGTQFIIITHRKGTMEAADYMYGVTMEEQGISKLVSVRFEG